MKWCHDWASTGTLALVLASRAGGASSAVVEASAVSNVVVTASQWDLRGEDDGGCGVAGCDPRLTRDGDDNTVVDSRWSCEPSLGDGSCSLYYELDDDFTISYVMIYFHESDDATTVAIPFSVGGASALTSPGTALGTGQKVNLPADSLGDNVSIVFTLTNDQWIGVSEVEIFLDVDDPDDVVIPTLETLSIVNAKTVSNIVASANYWDLSADGECGVAGCDPRLAADGDDNTVTASRWSCTPDDDYVWRESSWSHRCRLFFDLDNVHTISHVVVYVHESDDDTKSPVALDVFSCEGFSCTSHSGSVSPFVTKPGTALGAGERLNLPRPEAPGISIQPNLTATQWIDISEVEIFVEVTETNVQVAAAEAWTTVTSDTLSPVTVYASESIGDFGAALTRDGDDNTVASSHWSCNVTETTTYCALFLDFNDVYTISHLIMYFPDSDNATKAPVNFVVETCDAQFTGGFNDLFTCNYPPVGDYETKPGTPLGEGERVNIIRPTTPSIGIFYFDLEGATAEISEVEVYFEVPDPTPTPAPFVSSSDTEVDAADSGDGLNADDDDSAYFGGGVGDDASAAESDDGGVGASASSESGDGGDVGASSSSAPGTVSTGGGANNGPLSWTFTLIAVGAVSSMLTRATGLLQA